MFRFTSTIILLLLSCTAASNAKPTSMTFGIGLPASAPFYKALDEIYTQAFSQLNIKYKSVPCEPARCAEMVATGIIDGEPMRPKNYGRFSDSLLKIENSYFLEMLLVSICRRPIEDMNTIKALKDSQYKLAFQVGYRSFENFFNKNKAITVKHWRQGLALLKNKTIGCYMALQPVELVQMTKHLDDNYLVNTIQTPYENTTYVYLNKRHVELGVPLAQALQSMKNSGRINELLDKHGIFYQSINNWVPQ